MPHHVQRLQGRGVHPHGVERRAHEEEGRPDPGEGLGARPDPLGRPGPRRAASPRNAREALRARLGQVGQVRRRGREVRADDARDARGGQDPEVAPHARRDGHAPLPHRLADHGHRQDQARDPRGRARVREAAGAGGPDPVPESGRRPRRGLRRVEDRVRLLDELLGAGVRQRRRLHDQDDLRRGERASADPRDRIRARGHGLPLGPRDQRARRRRPHRAGAAGARDRRATPR